ncbi:MAG: LysR family transcriptional regulator [Pseudomonadota bacterium]
MQHLNWNDLKFVLALGRAGHLAGAARLLKVDSTTVSRRIKALERTLRADLFARTPSGGLRPTETGQRLIAEAERVEAALATLADNLGREAAEVAGTVRLTAVPIIVNRLIVPALPLLQARHPGLELELVPEGRDLDLTLREADLAIRLARPVTGGSAVIAQRIGHLAQAVYAAAGARHDLPWITYDDAHAHLPQARWMAAQAGATSGLRVADAETALAAAAAGFGKAVLPRAVGVGDPQLMPVAADEPPRREVWLLSHNAQQHLRAPAVVRAWVQSLHCWQAPSSGGSG